MELAAANPNARGASAEPLGEISSDGISLDSGSGTPTAVRRDRMSFSDSRLSAARPFKCRRRVNRVAIVPDHARDDARSEWMMKPPR